MFEITKQTVNASKGQFEEHPESYRPRVFVQTCTNLEEYMLDHSGLQPTMVVYELLTNGQAIEWPLFPDKETCGFDYWKLYCPQLRSLGMVRASHNETDVVVQGKVL